MTEFDTLSKRPSRNGNGNGHGGWHPGLRESATFDRSALAASRPGGPCTRPLRPSAC